jgi:hypothetical protein
MPVCISPCRLVASLLLTMISSSCGLETAPWRYCAGNLVANRIPVGVELTTSQLF